MDIIKTTLGMKIFCADLMNFIGPRGMDKLIKLNRAITITNDGATILDMLDIIHPAAKTLVDIAQS